MTKLLSQLFKVAMVKTIDQFILVILSVDRVD